MTRNKAARMQARAQYGTDDIEIDKRAAVSESDGGAWVAAWVWVSNEEIAAMQRESDEGDIT